MDYDNKYSDVPLENVSIDSGFWGGYMDLLRRTVLRYQWDVLNDRVDGAPESHAVMNFKIAAGHEKGEHRGTIFQDSDVAKWIEAVSYSLRTCPDPYLEKAVDEMIDIIAEAQQDNGYLDTYYILKKPGEQWTSLAGGHELYCAGHMIEAAVAYYEATGKRKLLDVVCRLVDHIDTVIGPETHKINGYPGHQEIELALVKLFRVTADKRYLELSKYFIDIRGKNPFFKLEYEKRKKAGLASSKYLWGDDEYQAHLPVRDQDTLEGHAVRAMYMCAGMMDVAVLTKDETLFAACQKLWGNVVTRRMYITGGIGSTSAGEAFTFDYDLPNDTAYNETCASIGLVFFSYRLLKSSPESYIADVLESALYNTVLAGMGQDGKSYFYVNPLNVWPEACMKDPNKKHVKYVRQKWFSCACCPPNIARLLASLGQYIYTTENKTVYIQLYINNKARINLDSGSIAIEQKTDYPWDGNVTLTISQLQQQEITLALRIPSWCRNHTILVNNREESCIIRNGYALIKKIWGKDDIVKIALDMPVELIQSNQEVRENAGKAAIRRGPLVYCIEETDNGSNLSSIVLSSEPEFSTFFDTNLGNGAVVITFNGKRMLSKQSKNPLYYPLSVESRDVKVIAVPYYLWGNRAPGEMAVWITY